MLAELRAKVVKACLTSSTVILPEPSVSQNLNALINKEQSQIKDDYNVDQVYPPKGFEIESYLTYNNSISSVGDIYNQIKNSKSFTVKLKSLKKALTASLRD